MLIMLFVISIPAHTVSQNQTATVNLPELTDTVTIHFDAFDVPHIYAHTAEDLFFAQGYIHASARWWQMEWSRHTGMGRLSELVGTEAVADDTLIHTLQIPRYAERDASQVAGPTARKLDAYVQGINAWITERSLDELAPEYGLIGYDHDTVRPWQRRDSLVLQSLQALSFNENSLLAEVVSGLIAEDVGELFVNVILPPYPYGIYPVTMEPGGTQPADEQTSSMTDEAYAAIAGLDLAYHTEITGSNAWVVSGERSETGMPLLANDTHMSIRMPSYWYQIGLHCVEITSECPYDVSGFSIPGSPGVIIGHNQHVAWGFTNAQTDMIDLYQLDLNPEQPNQYLFNDDYLDMDIETVTLQVAGSDPVEITIKNTRFGPVIDIFDGIVLPHAYALRWTVADGNRAVDAIFAANQATDWATFQAAFELFDAPGLNVLYADTDGNIGYLLSGRVPVRADEHDGKLPVDGNTNLYDWQGYVDPAELPRLFNPAQGYILSANNAMVDADAFPHTIAYFYDYGFRADRLETLIQNTAEHTIKSFTNILADTQHPAAEFLMPALNDLTLPDENLLRLRDWMNTWDQQNGVDSSHAALFNVFLSNVLIYGLDELPLYEASHSIYLLSTIIDIPIHPLWRNSDLELTNRDDVLTKAFVDAYDFLASEFGEEYESWRWGALHELQFEPDLLDYIDLGEEKITQLVPIVEAPGTLATLNVSNFNPLTGTFDATSLPSMRMIVDLSDFDQSQSINSTGQHGDYRNEHYADMIPLWTSGTLRDTAFSQVAVSLETITIWQLTP